MSPLRKKFEAEAKEYFAKYGYKRKRTSSGGYLYVKEYSENEAMVIFLSISSYKIPKHLFVTPQIGVRYENVEKIIKELVPLMNNEFQTESESLGYLMPVHSWIEYDYSESTDPEAYFAEMLEAIKLYGEPYVAKLSDIDNLISHVEGLGIGSARQWIISKLPILYYLRGYAMERGMSYIERVLKKAPKFGDMIFTDNYIEQYKKFYGTPPAGLEPVERKAAQGTAAPAADESKGKISGLIDKVRSLF